jgi:hypothetical protein
VIPTEPLHVIRMSWHPEAADYAEAFKARNRKRHVGWLVWAMCALGVAFAVLAVVGGQPAMAVFGVVIALFFAVMGRLGTGFLYQRNTALQQPVQVTVDEAGIAGDVPVVTMASGPMRVFPGGGQFPWAQLHSVLETKRVFVVHVAGQDDKTFFLLAKRGLSDPAEESALRALLTR